MPGKLLPVQGERGGFREGDTPADLGGWAETPAAAEIAYSSYPDVRLPPMTAGPLCLPGSASLLDLNRETASFCPSCWKEPSETAR